MSIVDSTDSIQKTNPSVDSVASVPAQDVGGGSTPPLMPRQTMTGNQRGSQTITGNLRIINGSFTITDNTVTFVTIDQNGIILNDGSTNRVLLGKQIGGF